MDIVFENATAGYRRREAPVLDALNLTVAPGRTILLGPNGAGKSTLLAVAASAMTLRSGSIAVGGLEPSGRRALARYRRAVGWMPQSIAVAGGLSVREHVALHGWLAGLGRAEAMSAAVETLAMVQLDDLQSRRATSLSGGQRARMGLAQALARGADVLLLDEPTAALDPDQRDSFLSLLACVAEGRTVLVSTHDVGDLTETYDRVVVLDRGRIRFDGTVRAFVDTGAAPLAPVEAYRRALGGG